jgi:hypothetical protein
VVISRGEKSLLTLADPAKCVCQNAGFFFGVEPSCSFRVANRLPFQTGTECNSPMRLRTTVPRATQSVEKACAVTQIDRVLETCAKGNGGNKLSAILTMCFSTTIAEHGAAGVWESCENHADRGGSSVSAASDPHL